jgi:hypothetical protein
MTADVKSVSTLFSIVGIVPPPNPPLRSQFFLDIPVLTTVTHTIHNNGQPNTDIDVEFIVTTQSGDFDFVFLATSPNDDCFDLTVMVPCMEGVPGSGPTLDNCLDGIDNDGDTLVDEDDPDCVPNINRMIVHLEDVPASVLQPVTRQMIAWCSQLGSYSFTLQGSAFPVNADDPNTGNNMTTREVSPPGYPTCIED